MPQAHFTIYKVTTRGSEGSTQIQTSLGCNGTWHAAWHEHIIGGDPESATRIDPKEDLRGACDGSCEHGLRDPQGMFLHSVPKPKPDKATNLSRRRSRGSLVADARAPARRPKR